MPGWEKRKCARKGSGEEGLHSPAFGANVAEAITLSREHWAEVARWWVHAKPQAIWRLHSDAVNARLIFRWLPNDRTARILKTDLFDEAVSVGLYPKLAQRARQVYGIDVSRVLAERSRRRYPALAVSCADVGRLPFPDATFDWIFSNSTLDHLASLEQIADSLRELHRVVRPRGRMVLTLDNRANPVVALRNALPFPLLSRLGLLAYRVGRTCGPATLRGLLEATGWKVCEMDAVLHCPRLLVMKLSSLMDRRASTRARERFLRALMHFEALGRLPTRYLTGYYVAAHAVPATVPARALS